MAKAVITVSLPSSSDKLRQNFPEDPKGDIQIIYKDKNFKLQKAHLRLQSNFFRKALASDRSILQIDHTFNEEFFSKILQCFYGTPLQINRKDALFYFLIAEYLEIDSIIKALRKDMAQHTSQYNFFQLFDLAYRISDQTLFQKCLLELQYHDFTQMRNQRQDLFKISQELLKLIIKTHNRAKKEKRILNAYEINNLITEYSKYKNFTEQQKNALKFELIDKNNLSSNQYKDIFIKQGHSNSAQNINFRKHQLRAMSLNPIRSENQVVINSLQGAQSYSLNFQFQKTIALQMDTTFQKKISEQLLQQKTKLANQLLNLNHATVNQSQKSKTIREQFTVIRKSMNQKQNKQKSLDKKIRSIDSDLSSLEKDLSNQSVRLKNLLNSTQQMMNKLDEQEKDKLGASLESSSSFWNKKQNSKHSKNTIVDFGFNIQTKSHKSHQNISVPSLSSKSDSQIKIIEMPVLQNDNISQTSKTKLDFYKDQSRVQFSTKSSIIKNIKQLNFLAQIVSSDRFTKNKFKLLFGSTVQNKIANPKRIIQSLTPPSLADTIRLKTKNRKNILFLMRTQMDKVIGGFVSVCLDLYKQGSIEDENAFLFSVSESKKFNVKYGQRQEAILIQKGYIICFSTDLMISDKLYEQQNYCEWPCTYEDTYDEDEHMDGRKSDWLTGQSIFAIKQIEVYQIQVAGSQMIL